MNRIAIVMALGFVVVGLWAYETSVAQSGQNRRGDEPPTGQPQQQQDRRPRDGERDKTVVVVNQIPSFMQAGRSYVFVPVSGKEFGGRVVSLDATGWVQVQHHPGPDVGPLAEWYNLANMTSVKAMN